MNTSKQLFISPEEMQAAIDAAPDQTEESAQLYKANSLEAVEAYWDNAVVTHSRDEVLQHYVKQQKTA